MSEVVGTLPGGDSANDRPRRGPSQATTIVKLVEAEISYASVELFADPEGVLFASAYLVGHCETWPMRSSEFRRWLAGLYHRTAKAVPSRSAIDDAIMLLEGWPAQTGVRRPVHVRKAVRPEGIYLDLGGDAYLSLLVRPGTGVVRIAHALSAGDVRFRRPRGLLPLPCPTDHDLAYAGVEELRRFLNLPPPNEGGDDIFMLIVAWLLAALGPEQPCPVLGLHGEQGGAKTTTARVLRRLIDPNTAELRTPPKEPRDLAIAARNGLVVGFDNVTHLPEWLSNALCCLATGGGFGVRRNYTDDEETLFTAMRPVLLTGINEVATAPDLLQRTILITLPPVTDKNRKYESGFWQEFEEARPRILSGLLNAVSEGLDRVADTALDGAPRMADFARFVTACEDFLGWEPGSFLTAYAGNRQEANDVALDGCPVTGPVIQLAEGEGFLGSSSELLEKLARMVPAEVVKSKHWPGNARALSALLRKVTPNLRQAGIEVERGKGKDRFVRIQRRGQEATQDRGEATQFIFADANVEEEVPF